MAKKSTATLVEKPVNVNYNFLSPTYHQTRHAGYLAIKLNILKDKQAGYESHKSFLTRCSEAKIVPKGLALDLQPTIGNHDEELLDN